MNDHRPLMSPDRRFLEIVPELPTNFPVPVLAKTDLRTSCRKRPTVTVATAINSRDQARESTKVPQGGSTLAAGDSFDSLSDAELYEQAMRKQAEEVAAFERAERIRKQASAGRWTGSRSPFAEN